MLSADTFGSLSKSLFPPSPRVSSAPAHTAGLRSALARVSCAASLSKWSLVARCSPPANAAVMSGHAALTLDSPTLASIATVCPSPPPCLTVGAGCQDAMCSVDCLSVSWPHAHSPGSLSPAPQLVTQQASPKGVDARSFAEGSPAAGSPGDRTAFGGPDDLAPSAADAKPVRAPACPCCSPRSAGLGGGVRGAGGPPIDSYWRAPGMVPSSRCSTRTGTRGASTGARPSTGHRRRAVTSSV